MTWARYILHYAAGYLTGTNAINIDRWTVHSKKQDDSRCTATRHVTSTACCWRLWSGPSSSREMLLWS